MKIYNITRFRVPVFISSVIIIAVFWVYTLVFAGGFNFGIDFKAGINVTVEVPAAPDEQAVRTVLGDLDPQVQTSGDQRGLFIVRIADNSSIENFQAEVTKILTERLEKAFGEVNIVGQEYIGTSFAANLGRQTIWLTLIALALILLYIWIRFKLDYAVAAIVATLHDVVFLLGFIGALQLEFSTATIAAVLTILGYSINDTIVIFDRIREGSRIIKDRSLVEIINISITQTLGRTLITSLTTLLAVVAILFFAKGTVRIFALNLVVGILVGTYSSIFIASPVLLFWHDSKVRKTQKSLAGHSHAAADASSKAQGTAKVAAADAVRQTAEEIAEATDKKAKAKAKKKKKKK
jgi:preprotein translocase subunit SecF